MGIPVLGKTEVLAHKVAGRLYNGKHKYDQAAQNAAHTFVCGHS